MKIDIENIFAKHINNSYFNKKEMFEDVTHGFMNKDKFSVKYDIKYVKIGANSK